VNVARSVVHVPAKAMTPGCTAEGDALRDQFATFQARGVEILGVSFDTPVDNATFVRQQGFPFRLLSDTDRTLATAVGAASDINQSAARRISYFIGPDGKVVKAYLQVTPATHARERHRSCNLPPGRRRRGR